MKKLAMIATPLISLFISGCSFFGVEEGIHRTLVVEKKPYRVVLSGDVQKEDVEAVSNVLEFLQKQPFKETKMDAIKIEVYGMQDTIHDISGTRRKSSEQDEENIEGE